MRAARAVALSLSLSLSLAACGPGTTTAVPTSTPWSVVSVPRQGVAPDAKAPPLLRILVPPHWTVAKADSAWFKRVETTVGGGSGRVKLLFLAEDEGHAAEPTAAITTWHLDGDYSVEDIENATFQEFYDEVGALLITARSVELGPLHARRLELRWDETTASGRETHWSLHYFAMRGRDVYSLQFNAPFAQRGELADVFDAIAATLTLP